MGNIETRTIKIKESFELLLQSRGGLGLQLAFRINNDGVVDVNRQGPDADRAVQPGDSLPVTYRVTGVGKGRALITFYEYQPWNKNFREVIQKEVQVEVVK